MPISTPSETPPMRGKSRPAALALLAGLVLFWGPAVARSQLDVPASQDYISDTAHVLQPDAVRAIDGWLQELQLKTGAQVKLLTVRTTRGEDIFSFVERQFEHWKLGQAGKNNGALIVLAVDDHKVRVHTGYGLEPVLPDSWCGSLSREAATTFFKGGKYNDGLVYMVKAVAFRVAEQQGVKLNGIPEQVHRAVEQDKVPVAATLLVVFFVLVFFYFAYKTRSGDDGRGGLTRRGIWLNQPWVDSGNSGWGGSFGGGASGGGTFGGGSFGGGGGTGGGGGGASW
jgi:uncharacterized protein